MNEENFKLTNKFKKFREDLLKTYTCPDVATAKNWEDKRAISLRKAFIESDIEKKWLSQNG